MTTPQSHTDLSRRTAPLPSGHDMPLLGFGTWQITGEVASQAVGWALEAGYRHLDTATMYGNEREVGAALGASGLARVMSSSPPSCRRTGPEPSARRWRRACGSWGPTTSTSG